MIKKRYDQCGLPKQFLTQRRAGLSEELKTAEILVFTRKSLEKNTEIRYNNE